MLRGSGHLERSGGGEDIGDPQGVGETEMDQLHEKLKSLQQQEHEQRVAYEEYLSNLTVG